MVSSPACPPDMPSLTEEQHAYHYCGKKKGDYCTASVSHTLLYSRPSIPTTHYHAMIPHDSSTHPRLVLDYPMSPTLCLVILEGTSFFPHSWNVPTQHYYPACLLISQDETGTVVPRCYFFIVPADTHVLHPMPLLPTEDSGTLDPPTTYLTFLLPAMRTELHTHTFWTSARMTFYNAVTLYMLQVGLI